ncbi:MAG TPA: hypothetical protein DEP57_06365 [Selenomonas sp.]|nr:hypothetical protein [Selenomonas sp.]
MKEADIKVHQEAQRDFLVYRNLLEEIGDEYAIVMVKSLESICNGREFVPDELKTLVASRVVFLVMDYPVMLTKIDLETNHMFLQLLMEVYTKPKAKLAELRAEKSKRLGRRKIGYPENWSELYDKWKAGEITGRDFMKATGLKRGTFYHMAAEYEEYMKSESIDQEQYGKK